MTLENPHKINRKYIFIHGGCVIVMLVPRWVIIPSYKFWGTTYFLQDVNVLCLTLLPMNPSHSFNPTVLVDFFWCLHIAVLQNISKLPFNQNKVGPPFGG